MTTALTLPSAFAHILVSTLFRIAVFLFLETAPLSIGKTIVSTLFLLYLSLVWLRTNHLPDHSPSMLEKLPPKNKHVYSYLKNKSNRQETASRSVRSSVCWTPGTLSVIIFSLPTASRRLRLLNLVINILIFAAAVEFTIFPFFDDASGVVYTRVGAIYHDAAKMSIRYPGISSSISVRLLWRRVPAFVDPADEMWKNGPSAELTADNDWIATVRLDGLLPDTSYEYKFQDLNGLFPQYPSDPMRFHTFPDPTSESGSRFRFVASSCAMPNFPYTPLRGRRIRGFDLLSDYIWPIRSPLAYRDTDTPATALGQKNAPTEFMIFMGDFIYADVPIYFGDDKEAYRRLYRRNYQSPSFRKVYERLPVFHTYDDHEFINNYAGRANDSTPPFPGANDAFELYNAKANYDSPVEGQHYYQFQYADSAFFVMDTRRYRSDVDEMDEEKRTMLGPTQLGVFYDWLAAVNNTATFKFIISSVPFTSLWQHDAQTDSWAGYSSEKTAMLKALHSVSNVIILSGDRHEFGAIEFTSSDDNGHSFTEISTSPLSTYWVPLYRTLKMESDNLINRTKKVSRVSENGVREVLSMEEEVPQERVLSYIWKGNYKWSSIEVDTRDQDRPVARIDIMIDGARAYNLTIHGQPIVPKPLDTLTSTDKYKTHIAHHRKGAFGQ